MSAALQLDVFAAPAPQSASAQPRRAPRGMARASDPATAHDAARRVAPLLTVLQQRVMEVYKRRGPITALECETDPSFNGLGQTTVKKRVSELAQRGELVDTGERRDRQIVWRLATDDERRARLAETGL